MAMSEAHARELRCHVHGKEQVSVALVNFLPAPSLVDHLLASILPRAFIFFLKWRITSALHRLVHTTFIKKPSKLAKVTIHEREKTKTIPRPRASREYLHQATTIPMVQSINNKKIYNF
jgi:hypothetical protein